MQPLPTITHAYRMLAQEEKQREISAPLQHENHALTADRRRYNDFQGRNNTYRPYSANTYQYNMSGSSKHGYKKPFTYYCDHCKVNGHSSERCFKLHGYPPGFIGFKNDKRTTASAYLDEPYGDDMTEYQQQF